LTRQALSAGWLHSSSRYGVTAVWLTASSGRASAEVCG